ncbi:MAG: hypothetical protein A4S09_13485 [Proteobacteria bacterium SG_bin7]|nr:MAG: hypothetical protein A4S09_13485 [Proteobacteria bacterium SG_bin7]
MVIDFEFIGLFFNKGVFIREKLYVGILLVSILGGCATLKDSLILGAGSGAAMGGIAGAQSAGDHSENTIKGAVIGGVVGGIASYLIHGSLEKRDADVRRETLMNLEHYEVMGYENVKAKSDKVSGSNCYSTQEVDGKLVSIPCRFTNPGYGEQ